MLWAGQLSLRLRPALDRARLIIAPNGVAYAPPEARPGIVPRLLQEILTTRIMVKAAMKRAPKSAKVSPRRCHALQELCCKSQFVHAQLGLMGAPISSHISCFSDPAVAGCVKAGVALKRMCKCQVACYA